MRQTRNSISNSMNEIGSEEGSRGIGGRGVIAGTEGRRGTTQIGDARIGRGRRRRRNGRSAGNCQLRRKP